jgi:hypothetical protein
MNFLEAPHTHALQHGQSHHIAIPEEATPWVGIRGR